MTEFQITEFRVVTNTREDARDVLLASFNIRVAGMVITGCGLLESSSTGKAYASGPRALKQSNGPICSVRFIDKELYQAVLEKALSVFEALTGREVA